MASIINVYEHVFPVTGGDNPTPEFGEMIYSIKNIYGTAFYIGQDCFITAGHVIRFAAENQFLGLGSRQGEAFLAVDKITDYEVLDDYDIGFIKSHVPGAKAFKWDLDLLLRLKDVQTLGFPYALDIKQWRVDLRAFKGYVVMSGRFADLKAQPRIYELSFQAPRGLSGAPLFIWKGSTPYIVGLIIGNATTETNILTSRERTSEGTETIYERYEALHFGIALQARALATVHSRILGSTLAEHLIKNNLLTEDATHSVSG